MRPSSFTVVAAGFALAAMWPGAVAVAQGDACGRYFPLDHRIPGRASEWNRAIKPRAAEHIQPVRIELPSIGLVTFYDGAPDRRVLTHSPSQAGLMVGRTYRVEISGMPEFPGVELYPTIELLDRLHPPPGQEDEFPIPLPLTVEEIEIALQDRLLTKVIYLEAPRCAVPRDGGTPITVDDLPPTANLLQAADHRGRAMAIIRLGGRTPDGQAGGDADFYGDLPPVVAETPQSPIVRNDRRAPSSKSPFEGLFDRKVAFGYIHATVPRQRER